ncbi:hypothetical protein CRV24_001463 [Beauveria bassiana]|nr:hypothetical protein CRV24_001463 [Beauveria bassiana]KAH8719943.1 hypothetical protein HC256_000351 [Beauveria bassiana]
MENTDADTPLWSIIFNNKGGAISDKGAPNAHTTYAGYINANLDRKTTQKFYRGHKLPQLQQLKKKFDPTSLFRNPQSVDPAE